VDCRGPGSRRHFRGVAVWKWKPEKEPQVMRFEYNLPEGQQFEDLAGRALAISPDGQQIVYAAHEGLYLRSINDFKARLIAGTQFAVEPFFSPDGKWVGYWSIADNQLKKDRR